MARGIVNPDGSITYTAGASKVEYGASTVRSGTVNFSADANAWGTVEVTFDEPMPDTDYLVTLESGATAYVHVQAVTRKTQSGFTIIFYNRDSLSGNGIINYTAFKLFTVEGLSDLESNVTELQENEYERLHINSYTAQTIKISGFQALTSGASGETFLLRERGGETILLSFGDNSQDVNASWNYNALRIAEGAKKITALNFDYANRDLYVTLGAYGALDVVQIGGVKDNLTYIEGTTVPSDNVYSIPIKTVTADNNFSTTPTEILTSASTYTVTEDVVLVKAVLATTETQYSGAEFVINGISVAAIGANSANSAVSQQNTFKCYKGDVLSKNVNTVGGATAGSCRVYVFKHA